MHAISLVGRGSLRAWITSWFGKSAREVRLHMNSAARSPLRSRPSHASVQGLASFEYDTAHCYAIHGRCAIQMWRGEVVREHVPLMEGRWLRLIEQQGTLAILVVVLPSAPPPSPQRREEIKRLYNGLAAHIKAVATVLEDQGIKGTAGSMVMTTIMLMSKIPYPYKNGTHVDSICAWLGEQVNGIEPHALTAFVESMRERYSEVCTREFGEPLIARLRGSSR
jgi:hypothetical protein